MIIRVGIVGDPDGWKALLSQEGVPHAVSRGDLTGDAFSAVVVDDSVDDRDIAMLRQYIALGGAVLCSANVYATLRGTTRNKKPIEYLLPDHDGPLADLGLVDLRRPSPTAWNANSLPSEDGSPTAYVGTFEGGHIIALPFDAAELVQSDTAVRASFYAPSERLPFERVSAVAKNGVRRIVRRSLEYLHHARGIPYAHIWYYPGSAPSVFALRIDTDYGSSGDVEQLYEFLRARRVPGSWFIDVKSQEHFLWRFQQMQGQEIGIHCYEHATYADEARNHENILEARHRLRELHLGAGGFAAPYGIWNAGLGRVINSFRFDYSSEFSWDYDNLPGEPWIGDRTRGVLQVPVHPISIGTLRRQGYGVPQMQAYFDRVVDEKLSHREPLLFYHHPKDGHLPVLERLFARAEAGGVDFTRMGDWARWWKLRTSSAWFVRLKEGSCLLEGTNVPQGFTLRIVRGDGQEAFVPASSRLRLETLSWQPVPRPVPVPDDIERARAFNPRIPLTLAVDALFRFRRRRA